jgi:hypothetical protein
VAEPVRGVGCSSDMNEIKIIRACRLLREVLRADLEIRRIVLQVERNRVLVTGASQDRTFGRPPRAVCPERPLLQHRLQAGQLSQVWFLLR